jgi:hypothetical protein
MFELESYFEKDLVKKELSIVKERWAKYTEGISEQDKNTLAVLLENQRLINEMSTHDATHRLKNSLIELASSMYKNLLQLNICHVMPMLGPTELHHELFKACTRKLETSYNYQAQPPARSTKEDESQHHSELIENLKPLLALDLFDEITTDLVNNHSMKRYIGQTETPFKSIMDFMDYIKQGNLKFPEWMVVGKEMAEKLGGKPSDYKGPEFVGNVRHHDSEISIIRNPRFKENEILFGRKEAYVHAGYVPICITPTVLDRETFTPRVGFLCRYDKKLLSSKSIYVLSLKDEVT